ncbi:MAG: hypothetical protein ACPGVH_00070 [Chitinophagales bacterium]
MKQILFLLAIILFMFSCKKGEVDCVDTNYTYETDVKSIIDKTCATANCHNSGSTNGDFTSYANMKFVLDNGEFNNRVFIKEDMPRARILSFKKKSILQCWMENNFKEK